MTNPPPIPWPALLTFVAVFAALAAVFINGLWHIRVIPIWAVPAGLGAAAVAYLLWMFDERKWP